MNGILYFTHQNNRTPDCKKRRDQHIKQDSWPSSSIIWISDMLLSFSIIRWTPGVPSVPYFSFGNEKALSEYLRRNISCYPLQGLLQDSECLRLCGSWVHLILQKYQALKMRTPPLTLKPLSSAEMKSLTSPGQRDIPWYSNPVSGVGAGCLGFRAHPDPLSLQDRWKVHLCRKAVESLWHFSMLPKYLIIYLIWEELSPTHSISWYKK